MADIVGMLAFAVLVPLGTWALFRFSQRAPEVGRGAAVLRLGPAVAVLGWISLALGVAMVGALFLDEMTEEPLVIVGLVVVVGLAFGAGGALMLLSHRHEFVRFSRDGVEGQTGFERFPTSLRWVNIERVRFSTVSGYLTLFGPDERKIRVSALLHESEEFAAVLLQRVSGEGVGQAVEGFRQYRTSYGMVKR